MGWLEKRTRSVGARTVLVTGASGGIGLELARVCARDGANLVLVARRAGELQKIAANLQDTHNVKVLCIVKDLSTPGAAQHIVDRLQDHKTTIDILINNAGSGDFGPFVDCNLERQHHIIQLNVTATVELTRLLLPGMIERGFGRILNVSSAAGFQPGPLMSVYYASKAFILHFSEALRSELSGTGVTVTTLCPGPVDTGFQKAARMETSGLFKKLAVQDPLTVAAKGYKGMLKGRAIVMTNLSMRLLVFSERLAPRSLVTRISHYLQKPLHE
jgi:short-subunit dehydrogenase